MERRRQHAEDAFEAEIGSHADTVAPDRVAAPWASVGPIRRDEDALGVRRGVDELELRELASVEQPDAVAQDERVDLEGQLVEQVLGQQLILKPLAWQGDLCFGPNRGTRVTFRRPSDAVPGWAGLPALEEAAPIALDTYFGAYGPARSEAFTFWMGGGWLRSTDLGRLVKPATGRLVEVDVEGRRAYVLAEHADSLARARPSQAIRLLPGFDSWVLGPGSKDASVIPPARRTEVSRQAGWIAPVVVAGGVVAGTWRLDGDDVAIAWFREAGIPLRGALADEVKRIGTFLGRSLDVEVTTS